MHWLPTQVRMGTTAIPSAGGKGRGRGGMMGGAGRGMGMGMGMGRGGFPGA